MDALGIIKTAAVLLFSLVVLSGPVIGPGQAEAKDTDAALRIELVNEYRDQLAFIKDEIKKVKEDLEWLSVRINRLKTMDRYIPERMHDSVAFKKEKIVSLTKLQSRYETLLAQKGIQEETILPGSGTIDEDISAKIKKSGLGDWLEVIRTDSRFRIENRLPILFPSASAAVAKQYHPFLKKLAMMVKGYNVRIAVDGYADMDPIHTKAYPSNLELGAARAANVAQILIKNGVRPSALKIGGSGRPSKEPGTASKQKAFDRQVKISVTFPG